MIKFLAVICIIIMFLSINYMISTDNTLSEIKRKQRKAESKLNVYGIKIDDLHYSSVKFQIGMKNNVDDIAMLSKRVAVIEEIDRKASYNVKKRGKAHKRN